MFFCSRQVLDIIAPPYSDEFVHLFLPVVQNEEITGSLRNAEKTDDVSTFISKNEHKDLSPSILLVIERSHKTVKEL